MHITCVCCYKAVYLLPGARCCAPSKKDAGRRRAWSANYFATKWLLHAKRYYLWKRGRGVLARARNSLVRAYIVRDVDVVEPEASEAWRWCGAEFGFAVDVFGIALHCFGPSVVFTPSRRGVPARTCSVCLCFATLNIYDAYEFITPRAALY